MRNMEKSEVFGLGESELKKWNVWIKIIKYVIKKMTIFLKTFFFKLNMRITDFVLSYNLYAQIWKKKIQKKRWQMQSREKKKQRAISEFTNFNYFIVFSCFFTIFFKWKFNKSDPLLTMLCKIWLSCENQISIYLSKRWTKRNLFKNKQNMTTIQETWLYNQRELFCLTLLISIISFTHIGWRESAGE